ncbi:hypothetical protein MMPV_006418 [Pyropia vietnamensis]
MAPAFIPALVRASPLTAAPAIVTARRPPRLVTGGRRRPPPTTPATPLTRRAASSTWSVRVACAGLPTWAKGAVGATATATPPPTPPSNSIPTTLTGGATAATAAAAATAASAACPPSTTALLLVDHGSRVAAANAALDDLAALVAARDDARRPVYVAHMELATPSIADGLAAAVARGARRVVVVPVFLAAGRHAREDIPALVAAAVEDIRRGGEGTAGVQVEVQVAGVLGVHPHVADLLLERAAEVSGDGVAAVSEGGGGMRATG